MTWLLGHRRIACMLAIVLFILFVIIVLEYRTYIIIRYVLYLAPTALWYKLCWCRIKHMPTIGPVCEIVLKLYLPIDAVSCQTETNNSSSKASKKSRETIKVVFANWLYFKKILAIETKTSLTISRQRRKRLVRASNFYFFYQVTNATHILC